MLVFSATGLRSKSGIAGRSWRGEGTWIPQENHPGGERGMNKKWEGRTEKPF